MKLYSGAESGNSWKISILLKQLDVPYETITAGLRQNWPAAVFDSIATLESAAILAALSWDF